MVCTKNSVFLIFWQIVCIFLTNINCNNHVKRNYATSIVGMEMLLEIEQQLLFKSKPYVQILGEEETAFRRFITETNTENQRALNNAEEYLSNPINGYRLIRRLHADWIKWELYLQEKLREKNINLLKFYRGALPDTNDMYIASEAIYRLQNIYDLDPYDISLGILNGTKYNVHLSSLDCFTIGVYLYNGENLQDSEMWLKRALQLYVDSDTNRAIKFTKSKIYQKYAIALFQLDEYKTAVSVINAALKYNFDENAILIETKNDIAYYQKYELTFKDLGIVESPKVESRFKRVCHDELPSKTSNLCCRYNHTTNAFLKLAPLKMEELLLDPYMVLYHDVLSDDEIEKLKQMAKPILQSFQVSRDIMVDMRSADSANFTDNSDAIVERITQRIADISGFDLVESDNMHIVNYGLAGHYRLHYDFTNESTNSVKLYGDRIATVTFYMSDVTQGGATKFPELNITVYPRKGTALLWYNMDNKGEVDARTAHTACPVIVGSKWIFTKWIRVNRQLFRKPCSTN